MQRPGPECKFVRQRIEISVWEQRGFPLEPALCCSCCRSAATRFRGRTFRVCVNVSPTFFSGVVWRVYVDAFDFSAVVGEEGFERGEVVALHEEVSGVFVSRGERAVAVDELIGDCQMAVLHGGASFPIKRSRHGGNYTQKEKNGIIRV